MPQRARIGSKGELRFGIIHDNNVAHACGGGAAADRAAIKDQHLEAGPGAFGCAGGPHDASAHNDDVKGLAHGHGDCLIALRPTSAGRVCDP